MKQVPGPEIDSKRKHDIVIFKKCGLSIRIHMNLYVANVLDLQFNLQNNVYRPYEKSDNDPIYINVQSNYPFQILKTLPNNIGKKLSSISSLRYVFQSSVKD